MHNMLQHSPFINEILFWRIKLHLFFVVVVACILFVFAADLKKIYLHTSFFCIVRMSPSFDVFPKINFTVVIVAMM